MDDDEQLANCFLWAGGDSGAARSPQNYAVPSSGAAHAEMGQPPRFVSPPVPMQSMGATAMAMMKPEKARSKRSRNPSESLAPKAGQPSCYVQGQPYQQQQSSMARANFSHEAVGGVDTYGAKAARMGKAPAALAGAMCGQYMAHGGQLQPPGGSQAGMADGSGMGCASYEHAQLAASCGMGSSGARGGNAVAALVEQFVENRRRRQETIDAHLDQVEDMLEQGDPVTFAFWTLDQDSSFYKTPGAAPRMLDELGKEIGLTKEQAVKLNAHRAAIRENRETISRCHEHLRRAREEAEKHIRNSSAITQELRQILEPVQVAKFFVWVEQNQRKLQHSMNQETPLS